MRFILINLVGSISRTSTPRIMEKAKAPGAWLIEDLLWRALGG